jgi:hypothetical protein
MLRLASLIRSDRAAARCASAINQQLPSGRSSSRDEIFWEPSTALHVHPRPIKIQVFDVLLTEHKEEATRVMPKHPGVRLRVELP